MPATMQTHANAGKKDILERGITQGKTIGPIVEGSLKSLHKNVQQPTPDPDLPEIGIGTVQSVTIDRCGFAYAPICGARDPMEMRPW